MDTDQLGVKVFSWPREAVKIRQIRKSVSD